MDRWAAFRRVARTRHLSGSNFRVYSVLLDDLAFDTFRPARQVTIARTLNLTQAQVSRCIRDLIQAGLVERGEREGIANTYKLPSGTNVHQSSINGLTFRRDLPSSPKRS